ncbi:MAG: chaperone modulator CbpM [Candidatus Binatia bacterium]|nr:chaperone modulator CbpM [Candidatus Binatia bacterium]
MKYFTRIQVIELLAIEESFFIQLEQEEIVQIETEDDEAEERFSEIMLERARVADNLVHELDVNLAGVAVIIQMRENLADLRHQLETALTQLRQQRR